VDFYYLQMLSTHFFTVSTSVSEIYSSKSENVLSSTERPVSVAYHVSAKAYLPRPRDAWKVSRWIFGIPLSKREVNTSPHGMMPSALFSLATSPYALMLSFVISLKVPYFVSESFALESPDRIVVDVMGSFQKIPSVIKIAKGNVEQVRFGQNETARIVVDVYENGIHLRGRDFVKGEFLPIASYWLDTTVQTVAAGTYEDPTGTITVNQPIG